MTENIGGASYSLDLDTGKFHAGAQQAEGDFNRVKAAGDRVASSSSGVSNALGSIGRTSLAVALGMGGLNLAVTGLSTALRGTIQAAADDAASQARLQAAVLASGHAYAEYARQLDDVITKGQQLGFSDDQTRASLAVLIAQTDSVAEATKRYAIAQDLSRLTGLDVVSASRLLGKVTEDNTRVLQRYGISVREGASATEVLAAVTQKAAGQAQAFADSPAGQFARTRDSASEAGEAIGTILLPAVAAASEQVAELATGIQAAAEELSGLGLGEHAATIFHELEVGVLAVAAALVILKSAELAYIATTLAADLVTGGLAVAMQSTAAKIGLFAVAAVAADIAIKKISGQSLFEHFSDADEKTRGATDALREYNDALLIVQKTLGNFNQLANVSTIAQALQAQLDKVAEAEKNVASNQALTIGGHVIVDFSFSGANEAQEAIDKLAETKGGLDALIDELPKFAAAQKDPIGALEQLRFILALIPGALDKVGPKLDEVEASFRKVAVGVNATAVAIRNARTEFDKGLKLAVGELDKPDAVVEGLKVTLLLLEQEKRHLEEIGDTQGIKNIDTQIASLNNRIEQLQAPTEIAKQAVIAWGAAAVEAAGNNQQAIDEATAATNDLADAITTLPREATIKLTLLDPEHIRDLLSAMAAGLSFDVAINLVSGTPKQQEDKLAETFAGSTPGSVQSNAVAAIVKNQAADNFSRFMEEVKRQSDEAAGAAHNFAGSTKEAAAGLSYLDKVLAAVSDGVIDLSEALALGLSDEQVVALELAKARGDDEAAAFRLRIGLLELAAVYPGLNGAQIQYALGLRAIAEELERSGRTAEQFIRDINMSTLESARSQVESLLGKPTRESLQLQLRLEMLQRQRILLQRGGAKDDSPQVKAIDKQINTLQQEIDLRQKDIDIMRIQAQLADQSIDTDRTLINAYIFLTAVIRNFSLALNDSIAPLQDLAGLGHAAAGGFHSGLTLVGEKGPEIVDLGGGVNIIPADVTKRILESPLPDLRPRLLSAPIVPQQKQLEGPSGPQASFAFSFNGLDFEGMKRDMNRAYDESVWEMRRRGSLPPGGAFSGR